MTKEPTWAQTHTLHPEEHAELSDSLEAVDARLRLPAEWLGLNAEAEASREPELEAGS